MCKKHKAIFALLLFSKQLHGCEKQNKIRILYSLMGSKCSQEKFVMNYVLLYMTKLYTELLEMKTLLFLYIY